MNYKIMAKIHAWILLIESAMMIPPLIISMCMHETKNVWGFTLTIIITFSLAAILSLISRDAKAKFYAKEGFDGYLLKPVNGSDLESKAGEASSDISEMIDSGILVNYVIAVSPCVRTLNKAFQNYIIRKMLAQIIVGIESVLQRHENSFRTDHASYLFH